MKICCEIVTRPLSLKDGNPLSQLKLCFTNQGGASNKGYLPGYECRQNKALYLEANLCIKLLSLLPTALSQKIPVIPMIIPKLTPEVSIPKASLALWFSSMMSIFAGSIIANFLLGEPSLTPFKNNNQLLLATAVW